MWPLERSLYHWCCLYLCENKRLGGGSGGGGGGGGGGGRGGGGFYQGSGHVKSPVHNY